MLTCIDVKFIFDSVCLGLSSSANILQIADMSSSELSSCCFAMFLAIILPSSSCSSYPWNEWNVCLFFNEISYNQKTKTTQPRPQVFSVTVP